MEKVFVFPVRCLWRNRPKAAWGVGIEIDGVRWLLPNTFLKKHKHALGVAKQLVRLYEVEGFYSVLWTTTLISQKTPNGA